MRPRLTDKQTIERIVQECYCIEDDDAVLSPDFRKPLLARRYLTKGELLEIVHWKAPRVLGRACQNSSAGIRAATRAAFRADNPSSAVWALCPLHGVQVRVASAILTIWDPQRYTVMDWRSCATLRNLQVGYTYRAYTPGTYATYVNACKELSEKYGVDLRTLDRYLWVEGPKQAAPNAPARP